MACDSQSPIKLLYSSKRLNQSAENVGFMVKVFTPRPYCRRAGAKGSLCTSPVPTTVSRK